MLVGQPLARNLGKSQSKALGIVERIIRGSAIVVPEALLIQIAEQVERLNAYIGSVDATLEKAPKVLQAVCVNLAINVLNRVIYDLMSVFSGKTFIGQQSIGVESRSRFDMLADFRLESLLLAVRDDRCANCS